MPLSSNGLGQVLILKMNWGLSSFTTLKDFVKFKYFFLRILFWSYLGLWVWKRNYLCVCMQRYTLFTCVMHMYIIYLYVCIVYVYVCICVHCLCACVHICMGSDVDVRWLPDLIPPHMLTQSLLLNAETIQLCNLTSRLALRQELGKREPDPLCLCFLSPDTIGRLLYLTFHVCSGDLNSGPYPCAANSLSLESALQPG